MKTTEPARFNTRLTKEQKDFFEFAASVGGYRTLTEFVIASVQERANKIIEVHNKIIASKKDQEVFFNELVNPSKPNQSLKKAAKIFNETLNL